MPTIREKRVFVESADTVSAYVASDLGVTVARISGDKVGEFTLEHRCTARDVAGTTRGVAVATSEDVLVGDGEDFDATGFGPAVAVAGYDGGVLAAGEDGRVAHYDGDWTDRGSVDGDVRALDADLVAASDGVHRVTSDGVDHAGLDAVRDVAAPGVPQAATSEGVLRLGNGWLDSLAGDTRVVAADPASAEPGAVGRAHAATPDACYEYGDGDWTERSLPVDERAADVAYAVDATVVLTTDGTLAVDAGDGFRHRSLGLRDAHAVAVVAEATSDGE
jgi:hypothetical protein